ncbi:MAG: hypothetical protein RL757_243 [Bacteroidota bacterium]|jgi:hypothetical protein
MKKIEKLIGATTIIASFALLLLLPSCRDNNKTGRLENCICPAVVDPVCGSNKKTYNNSCLAECDGILTYQKGECK